MLDVDGWVMHVSFPKGYSEELKAFPASSQACVSMSGSVPPSPGVWVRGWTGPTDDPHEGFLTQTCCFLFIVFIWPHQVLSGVWQCGIWFPDQGWKLGPLLWGRGVLATGLPGKFPFLKN